MAVIKITNFGGELPRVSVRALPADAAQVNSNLLATSTEFRPLLGDSAVGSAPAGAKTLHRLIRDSSGALLTSDAAGWIAETADKNYVKGQINDDATERTYVTFNDGSAAPRAIDATGANRLLGVPRPLTLTSSLLEVDEFTTDDALAADTTLTSDIIKATQGAMVSGQQGNGIPVAAPSAGTNWYGWYAHGVVPGLPSANPNQVNFCVPVSGGSMPDAFTFLKDAKYGGRETSGGFFVIALDMWATVWTIDPAALTSSLTALKDPSDLDGLTPLLESSEITYIVDEFTDFWSASSEPHLSAITTASVASQNFSRVIESLKAPESYSSTTYASAFSQLTGTSYAAAGEGFQRAFVQADTYATLPGGGFVASPSRYWINDGDPVMFANLMADVNACIRTSETGFRSFDESKFSGMLRTDFMLLINQQTTSKAGMLYSLNEKVDYCLAPFKEFFSASNQNLLGSKQITVTDRMIAFDAAYSEFKAALTALSNISSSLRSQTPQAAKNAYAVGAQARISAAAVVRNVEDRYYITTVVTDWGEESAPCDPTERLEIDQNDQVTLTFEATPAGRNLAKRRIYRSNSGSTAAAFQFTDEIPIAQATYTDTKKASELGEPCPTIGPDGITYWLEPPTRLNNEGAASSKSNSHLRGLTGMPNGVMAGHIDNFVAFCEPYAPYAWPIQYQIPLKHEIVGLGSFGQSLFVGTFANPSIISGSDSASMSEQMLDDAQACLSARSIVSAGSGVLYASPDGICFANSGGVEVITGALFAREDWTLLNPESIVAVMHEGVYYFWYSGNGGGCYALDMVAKKLARVDMPATAVFADSLTDAVFYTTGTSLKRAFSTGRRTGTWKSAKLEIEAQAPLAWGKVMGDQTIANPITLTWMGDDTLRYTKTVTDTQPWRLPPGRYLEHEVQISGAARVTKVFLASTTDELKGIT